MKCRYHFVLVFMSTLCSLVSVNTVGKETREPASIFDSYCFSCHGTGWEDAPVIGDADAWQPRADKGIAVLRENTIKGFNSMPAKGACTDCSDAELEQVVQWLLEQSL